MIQQILKTWSLSHQTTWYPPMSLFTLMCFVGPFELSLMVVHLFIKLHCKILKDGHLKMFATSYTAWSAGNNPEPFGSSLSLPYILVANKASLWNSTFAICTKTIFLNCFQFFFPNSKLLIWYRFFMFYKKSCERGISKTFAWIFKKFKMQVHLSI